jgi:protein-tyrosine phosphatase
MAEALLAHRLRRQGVDATVRSAGWLRDDDPASEGSRRELAGRGFDLSAHRSRRVTPAMLDAADLVLTMERAHARDAVLAHPPSWPRIFTLKELVRRGERAGPRRPGEDLAAWLGRVSADRTRADLLGGGDADDVTDPMGRPARFYARTAAEIEDLVDRLVGLAFPPGAPIASPARPTKELRT